MATNPSIPKVVKLDPKVCKRLEKLGEIKHRSPHWLMKEAIVRFLDQEEYNEKINRETVERWEKDFSEGNFVSHESMVQWLDTWGTDEESDPPWKK